MRPSLPAFSFLLSAAFLANAQDTDSSIHVSFSPRELPQKVATCKAINRAADAIKEIEIHYVDINPEATHTILMVHGWPSLWHSWKYQIEEFKNDYRLIIPDLRGFGASTFPGDVESSGQMSDLVGDLTCVLEHAKVSRAICMGHDWGSQTCYEAARMRPDVIDAVVGATIPYIPSAGEYTPIRALLPVVPKLSYQIFFSEQTPQASAELNEDVRRTLRATIRGARDPPPDEYLRDTGSFMKAWDGIEIPLISFFTPDEEDYWVEQYNIQKFNNNLYFYTQGNRYGSWEFAHTQGNATIPQPVLSILPNKDPVADWELVSKLLQNAAYLPNLTTKVMYGSHWVQLDNPTEFNQVVRDWLQTLPRSIGEHVHIGHAADDL